MRLTAILILGILFLALLDMAFDEQSGWSRIIREVKRRSREIW